MNYRHQFHAGNFADAFKHTLLLALVAGLQRKPKGFLYLDTHAGRGVYDLAAAAQGDSLQRRPEWPEGLGRLDATAPGARPLPVQRYLDAVEAFRQQQHEGAEPSPWLYPGSPWLVHRCLRPQDRMLLCERHPEEYAVLVNAMTGARRVRVEPVDGYAALRGALPPSERRALVLIDPPYEALDEFALVTGALVDGLRRVPGGTFAVWYPLTTRARVDKFFAELAGLRLPPTWTAEIVVIGPDAAPRMKGCGLLVVNPPWQLDQEVAPTVSWLAQTLAQYPVAHGAVRWVVPE